VEQKSVHIPLIISRYDSVRNLKPPGHLKIGAGDLKQNIIHFNDRTWKNPNRPYSPPHFPNTPGSNHLNIQSNMQLENVLARFNAHNNMLSIIRDVNKHRTNK